MLEHRVRPGLSFKAAFVSSVHSTALGGLGGLLLRLKQDGHGRMQLVGPAGTEGCLEALRSFIRWQHPAVGVTEVNTTASGGGGGAGAAPDAASGYQDRWLQVCAFGGSAAWFAPDWLKDEVPAAAAAAAGASGDSSSSSGANADSRSSSSSGEDEEDTSSSKGKASAGVSTNASDSSSPGTSEDSDSSSSSSSSEAESSEDEEEDNSCSKRGVDTAAHPPSVHDRAAKRAKQDDAFAALDAIFMAGGGGRGGGGDGGRRGGGRGGGLQQRPGSGGGGSARHLALQALQQAQGGAADRAQQQSEGVAAGKAAPPRKQTQPHRVQQKQPSDSQLLGFICHLPGVPARSSAATGSGALLAVLCCPHALLLPVLQRHPAVAALAACGPRVQAVVHLAPAPVAASPDYQAWIRQLPGRQVVAAGDAAAGGFEGVGFRAAARVSARLGLLSPGLFPLPHTARQEADDGQGLAALLAQAAAESRRAPSLPASEPGAAPGTGAAAEEADEPPLVIRQLQAGEIVQGQLLMQLTGPACDTTTLLSKGPAVDVAAVRTELLSERQALAPALQQLHEQRPGLLARDALAALVHGAAVAAEVEPHALWQQGMQQMMQGGINMGWPGAPHAGQWQLPMAMPWGMHPQQMAAGGWGMAAPPLVAPPRPPPVPPPRPPPGSPPKPAPRAPLHLPGDPPSGQPPGAPAPADGSNRSAAALLRARLGSSRPPPPPEAAASSQSPTEQKQEQLEPQQPQQQGAQDEQDSLVAQLAQDVAADQDTEPAPPLLTQAWAKSCGVVLLGTGSAEPSKYRGPSGILLRVCHQQQGARSGAAGAAASWMLLDCGEGTWGQVVRLLGPEGATRLVRADLG